MQVKFVQSRPGEGFVAGQTYDLSSEDAARLIKRGFAVAVEAVKPEEQPAKSRRKK